MIGHGLCFQGVKNADENELRSIATDPDDIHMYNVADFSFLLDIVDNLTDNLCNSVKGPGTVCMSLHHIVYISDWSNSVKTSSTILIFKYLGLPLYKNNVRWLLGSQ